MRINKETDDDLAFGHGDADWYVNVPDAVALLLKNRLRLFQGEYWPDTTQGMPWATDVLGYNSSSTYDALIRDTITSTPGVASIVSYSSTLNAARQLTINAVVQTIYGGPAAVVVTTESGFGIGPFDGPQTFGF